jgi:hypothetical protein
VTSISCLNLPQLLSLLPCYLGGCDLCLFDAMLMRSISVMIFGCLKASNVECYLARILNVILFPALILSYLIHEDFSFPKSE